MTSIPLSTQINLFEIIIYSCFILKKRSLSSRTSLQITPLNKKEEIVQFKKKNQFYWNKKSKFNSFDVDDLHSSIQVLSVIQLNNLLAVSRELIQ